MMKKRNVFAKRFQNQVIKLNVTGYASDIILNTETKKSTRHVIWRVTACKRTGLVHIIICEKQQKTTITIDRSNKWDPSKCSTEWMDKLVQHKRVKHGKFVASIFHIYLLAVNVQFPLLNEYVCNWFFCCPSHKIDDQKTITVYAEWLLSIGLSMLNWKDKHNYIIIKKNFKDTKWIWLNQVLQFSVLNSNIYMSTVNEW